MADNNGDGDRREGLRSVTVFDAEVGPGLAFIRSLGRVGVPVVVASPTPLIAGRFSRFVTQTRPAPASAWTDVFIAWLTDEFRSGSIDLVAPTSDFVSFCVAEALESIGRKSADAGHPPADSVRTCLFKDRFAEAMSSVGFPTPPTAAPASLDEAHDAAREIGYPLVVKPRSHVAVGNARGNVANTPADLTELFVQFRLGHGHHAALAHDPDLAWPLLQRYHPLGTIDVVSVTGCLDLDGTILALGYARKVSQSPRRFGVGTMFEEIPAPPFTSAAVDAVGEILGCGVFELEVIVDRDSGEHWAIDLNPRGFGQMSFDVALGRDLPALWYESVTGAELASHHRRRRPPRYWHSGLASFLGFAVRFAGGPRRREIAGHALHRIVSSSVGAMSDWRDPLPGLVFGVKQLRHPRALVKPFLTDIELAEALPERSTLPEEGTRP